MTNTILIAIVVALFFIARELNLLRKQAQRHQGDADRVPPTQKPRYKPTVFTFERSKYFEFTRAMFQVVGFGVGWMAWSKWIKSLLLNAFVNIIAFMPQPQPQWIASLLNLLGTIACGITCATILQVLIDGATEHYDERVFNRAFTSEERQAMQSMYEMALDSYGDEDEENAQQQVDECHKEMEEFYRSKGL